MRYPTPLTTIAAVISATMLVACGGGGGAGGSLPDATKSPVVVSVTQGASTVALGKSYVASATATSQPGAMQKMSWSVAKMTADAPDLTVSNGDCAAGTRNSKTINGITQSNWACDAVVTAPTSVAADSTYRVTFTGIDASGNSATDYRDVVVNAVPLTPNNPVPPVVATTPTVAAMSGADVGLNCFANGGFLKPGSKYVTTWVTKSNPSGLSLSLTPQNDGSLTFKAPLVAAPASVTMQCRVTDDNLQTATGDTVVTIAPSSGVTAVANAGASQTVLLNSVVTIDASSSAAPGNPTLYYKWVQIDGPTVSLSTDTGVRASFTAPAVTDTTRLLFRLYVSTTSPANPGTAAPAEQATVAVFVQPQAPLTLSVSTSQSVKSGVPVVLSVAATPISGTTLYYGWTQVAGPTVTLGGANTDKASFVAPTVVGSPVEMRFAVNVSRKPLSEAKPSEIVSSDSVVQVSP
ncbi:hypothetical protein ABIC83_002562 [Roseateles asaccharophilus]|uniref:PKD domain-containing protein n=1 Tax=Roseateles asaccharophilus TaxID=582607 RepID=UPI00383734FC